MNQLRDLRFTGGPIFYYHHLRKTGRSYMIRTTICAAMTIALTIVTPALAGWETTQWGMSPDEALAALDGAETKTPTPAEFYNDRGKTFKPLVKLNTQLDKIKVEASLLFDSDNRLASVLINPTAVDDCMALREHLVAQHGNGNEIKSGPISITEWEAGSDLIKLTATPSIGLCNLSYRPG
ncbi:hypothetical protein ABFT80_26280 [Mesorhizobium sp. SB112]|uniref:hypothetical protein n=1 Tax=Mesorhizobium sp. SB112 TaxID=3151853 RepID=UPI0032677ACD